ncbi:MAG: TauD/TfdA dioxygenase family protein [Betaproteobacteria bacterium]
MTMASSLAAPTTAKSGISVTPTGGYFGAEIGSVDLCGPLAPDQVAAIADALARFEVLVFREQDINLDELTRFGEHFGELSVHPFSFNREDKPKVMLLDNSPDNPPQLTDRWHSDETFRREPPLGTILSAKVVPPHGGDTVFASMTAAYRGLSERMQRYLHGLEAVHDFKPFRLLFSETPEARQKLRELEDQYPNPSHPVVRVHPVSGKRIIFVNPQFTIRIKGISEEENDAVLALLYSLARIPEYQLRVRWQPGTVVFWDNRSTQHYAPHDYYPHKRSMERITIRGDAPIGVQGEYTPQQEGDEARWLRMRAEASKQFKHPSRLY